MKINTFQASILFNVSVRTIYRWIKQGKLKAEKKKDGRLYVWEITVGLEPKKTP